MCENIVKIVNIVKIRKMSQNAQWVESKNMLAELTSQVAQEKPHYHSRSSLHAGSVEMSEAV